MNRRRFLSTAATGAGAAMAACSRTPGTSEIGTLATTTRTPILPKPTYFEPLIEAAQFQRMETPVVTLRMIIRGLCAIVIWEDAVDIVLMDARKHGMTPHVGKFTVEDDFAITGASSDPLAEGVVEEDHAEYVPIRAWDIRGSILTFSAEDPLPESDRIRIIHQPEVNPWSSMAWHLDFERLYPQGVLRPRTQFDTAADGAIAAVVRLTHGWLQAALPARRYGNTGVWEMATAGDIPDDQREFWLQALTDTTLYSLSVPAGKTVTLSRTPLTGYDPGPDAPPNYSPIRLTAPAMPGAPLPCGLSHEPPLGGATHTSDLRHNRMFYELFTNPPVQKFQTVPTLIQQWVDRGVGRESRSAYWGVTRDPGSGDFQVNVCDPNCNKGVFGMAAWRARQDAAAKNERA
jgi:hypothetical protein